MDLFKTALTYINNTSTQTVVLRAASYLQIKREKYDP